MVTKTKANSRPRQERFNLLLIVTDQERSWSTLPADLQLPWRSFLRNAGTDFRRHHANALACGPSRSTLYTGQHITRTRVFDNPGRAAGRKDLDPSLTPTIGQMLKRLGYATAYKSKWHLSNINSMQLDDYSAALRPFGFDEWQKTADVYGTTQEGSRTDEAIATDAVEWLSRRRRGERPWLLAVNLVNPHDVMFYDASGRQQKERLGSKDADGMAGAPARAPYDRFLGHDLPPSFMDSLGSKPRAHAAFVEQSDLLYGPIPITDVEAWRRYQNYYFNCLADVDQQIGRIVTAARHLPEAHRTVILFTSDHGEMGSSHALRGKGPVIYRENLNVPLVVVHPRVEGGTMVERITAAVDVVPTLLSMAGVDPLEQSRAFPELRGHDFSPLLGGASKAGPRDSSGSVAAYSAVHASFPGPYRKFMARAPSDATPMPHPSFPDDFVQFDLRSFYRALFNDRYSYARYFSPGNHHRPATWDQLVANNDLELYDREEDPHQLNNLAAEPDRHRDLLLSLNEALNELADRELGIDDGSHMPGPRTLWARSA